MKTLTNKLYYNFRPWYFNKGAWKYTVEYILGQQFSDYKWLIEIEDTILSADKYTKINANWMKNLTEFLIYSYVDWVNEEDLQANINAISSYTNLIAMTVEEARDFIRNRTSLEETDTEWTFILREEYTDEMWEFHETEYLIIN